MPTTLDVQKKKRKFVRLCDFVFLFAFLYISKDIKKKLKNKHKHEKPLKSEGCLHTHTLTHAIPYKRKILEGVFAVLFEIFIFIHFVCLFFFCF